MTTCKTCGYREGAPVSASGSCFGAPPAVLMIEGEPTRVRPLMYANDRACGLYRIAEVLTGGSDARAPRQAISPNNPAVQAMEGDHG